MLSAESVMLIGVGHKEGRRYGKGNCRGSRLRKRGVPCAARSWYARLREGNLIKVVAEAGRPIGADC